jgi:hypothetical protein
MTKDTFLPQDPELLRVFKSSPQKILRTARSLRITHSHARDNINKIKKQFTNQFKQKQNLH